MSTNYVLDRCVSTVQFVKALAELGYTYDKDVEGATDDYYPFSDGENYAWISLGDNGVENFSSYGRNDDSLIYNIAGHIGVACYHEHESEFHQIIEDDDDSRGMVMISIEDLNAAASDIISIDTDGKSTTIKKDGEFLS